MRMHVRLHLAAPPLLAMGLFSASCVDLLGIVDLPPKHPRYSRCAEVFYPAAACASCVDESCCEEAEACAADGECAADLACRSRCDVSDAACRIACTTAHPSAGNPVRDLETCRRRRCAGACVGCGSYVDPIGPACTTCMERRCCAKAAACAARPGCDEAAADSVACADPSCILPEVSVSLEDYDVLIELAQCGANCSAECGFGRQWDCDRAFMIPEGSAKPLTYTVELYSFPLGSPLEGLFVKACENLACDPPVATAHSDDDGVAVLKDLYSNFTPGFSGFTGFLDISDTRTPPRVVPHLQSIERMFVDRIDRLQLVTVDTVNLLEGKVNGAFETSAVALFVAGDCTRNLAPDVTFEVAAPYAVDKVWYVESLNGGVGVDGVRTSTAGAGFAVYPMGGGYSLPSERIDFTVKLDAKAVGGGWMPLRVGTISRGFGEPTEK
jgi:hypothetical protein